MMNLFKMLETKAVALILFVVAFAFLGTYYTLVVPLMNEDLYTPTKDATPYTELELAGKRFYQSEGCWYCHTQQVRTLLFEAKRYGMGEAETFKRFGIRAAILAPPSVPGEYTYDKPHLLGTRRIGPDLARVGGKYDNTWLINHFRNPRTTSPGSIMPAFTWYFDKAGKPSQELLALVAYLQKLGTNIKWREEGIAQYKKLHPAKEEEVSRIDEKVNKKEQEKI